VTNLSRLGLKVFDQQIEKVADHLEADSSYLLRLAAVAAAAVTVVDLDEWNS